MAAKAAELKRVRHPAATRAPSLPARALAPELAPVLMHAPPRAVVAPPHDARLRVCLRADRGEQLGPREYADEDRGDGAAGRGRQSHPAQRQGQGQGAPRLGRRGPGLLSRRAKLCGALVCTVFSIMLRCPADLETGKSPRVYSSGLYGTGFRPPLGT